MFDDDSDYGFYVGVLIFMMLFISISTTIIFAVDDSGGISSKERALENYKIYTTRNKLTPNSCSTAYYGGSLTCTATTEGKAFIEMECLGARSYEGTGQCTISKTR
jgi:hypothetical protein